MAAVKSAKRQQTSDKLIRMRPEERAFLDAATSQVAVRLRETHATAKYGLTNFMMEAALKAAAETLGCSLQEWTPGGSRTKRKDGR